MARCEHALGNKQAPQGSDAFPVPQFQSLITKRVSGPDAYGGLLHRSTRPQVWFDVTALGAPLSHLRCRPQDLPNPKAHSALAALCGLQPPLLNPLTFLTPHNPNPYSAQEPTLPSS